MASTHAISLDEAIKMTAKYRDEKENILKPSHREQNILAQSEAFEKDAIQFLLDQSNCVKIRVYYGMDDDMKVHAILVGVNSNDEDILPTDESAENGEIVERGMRCPTICPTSSPLNE